MLLISCLNQNIYRVVVILAELEDLQGTQKLRDAWKIIERNEVAINEEVMGQQALIDALQSGDSSAAANAARLSTPYGVTYATLKARVDHTDEVAIGLQSDVATQHASIIALQTNVAQIVINVKAAPYNAVGNGIANDSVAIQTAVNAAKLTGGTVYFPAGKYKLLTQIDINFDQNTPISANKGINIKGDNPNSTQIINATASSYAFNADETFDDGHATASFFHMENVMLTGTLSNKGLRMHGISEQYIENVVFQGLGNATDLEDVVRCRFVSCEWNGNQNGVRGLNQVTISTPNAIEFYGCYFYGTGQQPAYFFGGCNVNFYGGTIESSGFNRGGVNNSGIRFVNSGRYGGAICNINGVYFEGNQNIADIWITVINYPGTYNIIGCTFNKFAPPNDNINSIYAETSGNAGTTSFINVSGCCFKDYGNTPSTGTKYIQCVGNPLFLEEFGNYYQSQLEIPSKITNRTYATARFTNMSTTPALVNGFNISSIIRNAIGDYTITFTLPSVNSAKITIPSCGQGFCEVTLETTSTVRIKTYNITGVAFDPAYLMLMCTQA